MVVRFPLSRAVRQTTAVAPASGLAAWAWGLSQQAPPQAIRNRQEYFRRLLARTDVRHQFERVRVLSLASGAGGDLREFHESRRGARVSIHCLGPDEHQTWYARDLSRPYLDGVSFAQSTEQQLQMAGAFELVWSAGLFDYFDDVAFVWQLRRLLRVVAPTGCAVIGNLRPTHAAHRRTYVCGTSRLYYRTASHLAKLGATADTANEFRLHIETEPSGMNLFLHLVRA